MPELHRKTHWVSHFQIDLLSKGAKMSEFDVGGTLVSFAAGHINVATAWDENGTVPPHVEIVLSGYEPLPVSGIAGLFPAAAGPFDVGHGGVEVGNFIMSDVVLVPVPKGRYVVSVFLDKFEAMTARQVHFHLRPAQ